MEPRKIREGIFWMGAVDWDRRLFDSLIPLPDGTSYNAYLVQGKEKTVLLDTVDPTMTDKLLTQLESVRKLDYLVAHHAEQDHAGSIPHVLQKYPDAKLVTTPKGKEFLVELLHIPPERFITVSDRETISLGGKTLEFIYTPWVHWPETMVTYLREEKILFSCDFFGSHLATTDLYAVDKARTYRAAKRYFAEIMMPFSKIIEKNLEKLKDLQIDIIAPSHGPIHNDPSFIITAYRDWVSGAPKNIVLLPYISMHGSTRKMVDYFTGALVERGVSVQRFDLTVTDLGELAASLIDAATIVLGAPTVLAGAHPAVIHAAHLAAALRPKAKFASIIGSYGWGGKTLEQLASILSPLKLEILQPVLCKGLPREADFKALDNLADTIAQKHRSTTPAGVVNV